MMNSTFSGLAFFCRDLDLDESLISKYQPNQILMERGFTDLTYKIGGFAKNCRYLVASSSGKDISMFSQNPELGHILIRSSAYFKVLDIQKGNGKTQILLLNIPAEGVPIFGNSKINIEDKIIETGIEIFKENIDAKPLHDLQSEDWIERTSFPIGMNEEGIFFLDMPPNLPQNTEALSTNEATSNDTEGTSSAQNTPVAEKPKAKKKGFWNTLFEK